MKVPINEVGRISLDAPMLPAEEVQIGGVTCWRVWCRHCQAWHYHGPAEGHARRIAATTPHPTGRRVTIWLQAGLEQHSGFGVGSMWRYMTF
jgi:hypothetical protein